MRETASSDSREKRQRADRATDVFVCAALQTPIREATVDERPWTSLPQRALIPGQRRRGLERLAGRHLRVRLVVLVRKVSLMRLSGIAPALEQELEPLEVGLHEQSVGRVLIVRHP